ncbi:hypothetical protein MGI18_24155 [Bacillus sp. OVS6]|nr:hypothetical protein MGI18_24155 [Bacillus sp. OVS6]
MLIKKISKKEELKAEEFEKNLKPLIKINCKLKVPILGLVFFIGSDFKYSTASMPSCRSSLKTLLNKSALSFS